MSLSESASSPLLDQPSVVSHDIVICTFDRFQELPAEIRIKIWKLVAHAEPSTFHLQWVSSEFIHRELSYPAPPILLLCRESRFEGLKYYTLCHENNGDFMRGVYINLSVDQFSFRLNNIKRQPHRTAFAPSGKLNFDVQTLKSIRSLEYEIADFLKPLTTLLAMQEPESRISVTFKGRARTPDRVRSLSLLRLHIRFLPTHVRRLPHGKFIYHTENGDSYTLTGETSQVTSFLRSQTSF